MHVCMCVCVYVCMYYLLQVLDAHGDVLQLVKGLTRPLVEFAEAHLCRAVDLGGGCGGNWGDG
jgi:hypothetical protein